MAGQSEPQGTMGFRILLIEDDDTLRMLITSGFVASGHNVHQAANALQGIQILEEFDPDLAVIDLQLPDLNGIEVIRQIRPRCRAVLIILTAYSNTSDVVNALEAGADDFLSKPIELRELEARIGALMRRADIGRSQADDEFRHLGFVLELSSGEVRFQNSAVSLTKTEFALLLELLRATGAVVSKEQLLRQVWGYDYLAETRLVDTQIYRLRQKLGFVGATDLLQTVRGRGFRMVDMTQA